MMKTFKFSGFTLVEMAVVLVIMALLLGGLLSPLTAQIDQKNYTEVKRALESAKEALMGYGLSNKHLPCPDKTAGANNGINDRPNDGVEDFSAAGNCITQEGNLPWATLSLAERDPWEQRFIYRVTAAYSQRAPLFTFGLATNGNLRVCNAALCAVPRLTDVAVAVIVSKGKNAGSCSTAPSPPACADERANDDGNNDFVSHTPTVTGSANGEYDDVVVWLSSNILINRMVTAGQLP
ncbi:MAG: type II secretion system protein [Methylotenera sp.]|nr:type II secretion system protein [Methylotenera sp.]MDD4925253.1 type II secretion system protein [Methylotenera sp.]MDO9283126.1 type II secretion system protein [Methylotenera sp.]